MSSAALLLTLAAAFVHAGWNILLSSSEDIHSATAVAVAAGAVLFAPVAVVDWHVESSAVPYLIASSALEVLYLLLLAISYSRAAMSLVYPIARGSAPVFVLVAGLIALGAGVSVLAAVGVLLVAIGIVLVRGLRAVRGSRDLALALAVGGCIAGYTLVDKHGIAHAAPPAYLEIVLGAMAVVYLVGAGSVRGVHALRTAISARTFVAGAGFFGAYALVLAALKLAPAASVAAVRESSVLIAAAILALSGRERITFERFAGATGVVAGVALISLG